MFPTVPLTEDTEPLDEFLAHTMGGFTKPVTLVLDQVESVSSRKGRNLIPALARALPAGSQLALASREQVPFSLAQLRVQRVASWSSVPQISRMSPREASLLLRAAGLDLADEATDRLVRQTQGWPAALSLAAAGDPQAVMCHQTKGSVVRIG